MLAVGTTNTNQTMAFEWATKKKSFGFIANSNQRQHKYKTDTNKRETGKKKNENRLKIILCERVQKKNLWLQ